MNNLRKEREKKSVTLKEVSERVGIAESQLSFYERGKRQPKDPETWQKLANYFDVSVPYIMGLTPNSSVNAVDSDMNETTIEIKLLTLGKDENLDSLGKDSLETLVEIIDSAIQKNDVETLRVFYKYLDFFKRIYLEKTPDSPFHSTNKDNSLKLATMAFMKENSYHTQQLIEVFLKEFDR